MSALARRAGPADAEALLRLRVLMLEGMGVPVGEPDAPWRREALAWFTTRLADPASFAAFVVDDPRDGVVSSAAGVVERHAPGPGSPTGDHGRVFNVSTAPGHRRRGLARACTAALLGWFDRETAVTVVDLSATADGAALYRELGFAAPRHLALQRRRG